MNERARIEDWYRSQQLIHERRQIEGTKHWKLYEPAIMHPRSGK